MATPKPRRPHLTIVGRASHFLPSGLKLPACASMMPRCRGNRPCRAGMMARRISRMMISHAPGSRCNSSCGDRKQRPGGGVMCIGPPARRTRWSLEGAILFEEPGVKAVESPSGPMVALIRATRAPAHSWLYSGARARKGTRRWRGPSFRDRYPRPWWQAGSQRFAAGLSCRGEPNHLPLTRSGVESGSGDRPWLSRGSSDHGESSHTIARITPG